MVLNLLLLITCFCYLAIFLIIDQNEEHFVCFSLVVLFAISLVHGLIIFLVNFSFQGKLPAVLRIYRDTLASDIKTSVKMTVLNMHLESDSISGEGIVDTDGGSNASIHNYKFITLYICTYILLKHLTIYKHSVTSLYFRLLLFVNYKYGNVHWRNFLCQILSYLYKILLDVNV